MTFVEVGKLGPERFFLVYNLPPSKKDRRLMEGER